MDNIWETPECTAVNRLPPRATLIPFKDVEAARTLDRRPLAVLPPAQRPMAVQAPAATGGRRGRLRR